MATGKKFDDIFETTAAPKQAAKKAPAKQASAPAASPAKSGDGRGEALRAALTAHHQQVLQRKDREDRFFIWGTALIAAVVLVGFATFYGATGVGWWSRIFVKLLLCGAVGASALFTGSLIETNRQKIHDLTAMVIKINEGLGFFEPGRYDDTGEPFYPHSYKFVGSESDEETIRKGAFVKGAAAFAIVLILIFL